MRVGDILEWAAALAFVAGAYLAVGPYLALIVAGVALSYFAQCYDGPVKLPKLRRHPRPEPVESREVTFHCAHCDGESPSAEDHVCPVL